MISQKKKNLSYNSNTVNLGMGDDDGRPLFDQVINNRVPDDDGGSRTFLVLSTMRVGGGSLM
jgi:hypothetical protein